MSRLKIAFMTNNPYHMEILTVPLLSALAKNQGHETRLFNFSRSVKKAVTEVLSYKPDIIAYSVCSNEADAYLAINGILKRQMEFFSLFGGPHPTFFPSYAEKKGVDAICRGEADLCFPQFLKYFGTDKMYGVSNFSFNDGNGGLVINPLADLVEDLSDLPAPDRDIVYSQNSFLANHPTKTFLSGRGCPHGCSYCFNHAYNSMYKGKGRLLRTKSVTCLINEIKSVAEKYPLAYVKFLDDIFGYDEEWLEEFAVRFSAEIGLPFFCLARPNMISDNFCRRLKKAGCHTVLTAIECGSEHIRNSVLNRNITDEQIITACEKLKKHGIKIWTLNMIGLPGESEEEILQTVEINRRIGADLADASVFQPYPGTKITKYCIENGYLPPDFDQFQNFFSSTVLSLNWEMKEKIFVLFRIFTFLVDHPLPDITLRMLYKAGRYSFIKGLYELFFRIYWAYKMRFTIYRNLRFKPGLKNICAACTLLFAKTR